MRRTTAEGIRGDKDGCALFLHRRGPIADKGVSQGSLIYFSNHRAESIVNIAENYEFYSDEPKFNP